MKSSFAIAAALAPLALAQGYLDVQQINNAPAPTATAPPEVNSVDMAAVEASLSSAVTAATATATTAPAKFRMARAADPTFWWPGKDKDCNTWGWWKPCKPNNPGHPSPNPHPEPNPHPPQPQPNPHPQPQPSPQPQPKPDNACQVQEPGAGPTIRDPDTPAAFLNNQQIKDAATQASTPSGYKQVFQNVQAAYQGASYLTYKNLDSYSPEACAAFCNSEKCSSFNIYFERAPSVNPNTDAKNETANCPNPPSTTYIRCAIYGAAIDAQGATNSGQFRDQFQVVIAGSNGYTKPGAPISCPGYQAPKPCDGAIGDKGKNWWLGDKFFPGGFNPDFCRIFAKVQTAKNIAAAKAKGLQNYSPCNSFNAFEVYEDGEMVGTYCKLFTEKLPVAWAEWKKEIIVGKTWECKNSWFYDIINKDFGKF